MSCVFLALEPPILKPPRPRGGRCRPSAVVNADSVNTGGFRFPDSWGASCSDQVAGRDVATPRIRTPRGLALVCNPGPSFTHYKRRGILSEEIWVGKPRRRAAIPLGRHNVQGSSAKRSRSENRGGVRRPFLWGRMPGGSMLYR